MPVKKPRWPPWNLVFMSFQHQTAVISRASSWSPCLFLYFFISLFLYFFFNFLFFFLLFFHTYLSNLLLKQLCLYMRHVHSVASCDLGYLSEDHEVERHSSNSATSLGPQKYCGNLRPPTITSDGPRMKITLNTTNAKLGGKFAARYQFITGETSIFSC